MCGISGFIDYSKSLSPSSVNDMVKVLSHRGPDYLGAEFHENNDFSIGFGHSRLSIIDLSPNANQPFFMILKNIGWYSTVRYIIF